MSARYWLLLTTIHLHGWLRSGWCLRDVIVSVPEAVRRGERAILNCSFQLDGDALYTVKWYKASSEFFRYTPKETPQVKIFPTHGIKVTDVERDSSNMNSVTLPRVGEGMSGRYSCEVSADAPSFHTAMVSSHMTVVLVPKTSPSLSGLRSRYRAGDTMFANCTAIGSRPAANITWVVNSKSVDTRFVRQYREVTNDDLETSISTVEIPVIPSYFHYGRLKIKCQVSIFTVYWKTMERSIELLGKGDHPNQSYSSSDREMRPRIGHHDDNHPHHHYDADDEESEMGMNGSWKSGGSSNDLNLASLLTMTTFTWLKRD